MERETVLELFDRYADMVYRVALSYLRSLQEAEDVVQTVFLKLLEGNVAVYPGKERAFLTKITINRCKNFLSAAKRHETVPLDGAVLLVQPEDRDLFRAVMELPEKYRIVVGLHYFEGCSFREISELLHIGAPATYGVASPGSKGVFSLDEMIESIRFKTDDWPAGNRINGGAGADGYTMWDTVEVLSSDPALRSRLVGRADGAEKMEYTAENPINLLDTLTGRVTIDLTWMNDNYKYIPDSNMSFVVADKRGNYVSELFEALYAKPDESGYIRGEFYNRAQERRDDPSYIIDGSYETAYYHTTPDGYEFLVKLDKGRVWADCDMSHASISLFGMYLTSDEVEDILDNLSLSVEAQP